MSALLTLLGWKTYVDRRLQQTNNQIEEHYQIIHGLHESLSKSLTIRSQVEATASELDKQGNALITLNERLGRHNQHLFLNRRANWRSRIHPLR